MSKVFKRAGRSVGKLFGFRTGSGRSLSNPDTTAIDQQRAADEAKNRSRFAINKLFIKQGSPTNESVNAPLYDQRRQAAFDLNKGILDDEVSKTREQQKISMFDRGNIGGSADVLERSDITNTYQKGVAEIGSQADRLKNQWLADDESARLNLLAQVDSGMDEATAASNANAAIAAAARRAGADSMGRFVGNLFDTSGQAYQGWRQNQGQNAPIGQPMPSARDSWRRLFRR